MARKQYQMDEVLRVLRNKNDIRVNSETKQIFMLTETVFIKGIEQPNPAKKHDCGNGTWGKLDYLTRHNNFRISLIDKF